MTEQVDELGQLLAVGMAGDAKSYALFLHAVTPVLRGIVRAKGSGLGDTACEDVLQEVLLAIHLKRHTWDRSSPVRPWLYAIARYKVIDALRSRGRMIELPIEELSWGLEAEIGPDPTDSADMAKMIGMLDERSALIIRKIGVEGESVAATGAALNMTDGAVRVALHRALKALAVLREKHIK